MTGASGDRPWPPLIVAEHIPRSVRWRDALLTGLAWGAFAFLLEKELAPVFGGLQALGLGDYGVKVDWLAYLERLAPFLLVASGLAVLLVGFSVRTQRRRSRSLLLPQPAALERIDEARRVGLDEAALVAARDQPIVIVHIDDAGLRIEVKGEA
jgi:poly-beta-1,6-N-acetyl-D-glucosamine biosynthesis protein PgaD